MTNFLFFNNHSSGEVRVATHDMLNAHKRMVDLWDTGNPSRVFLWRDLINASNRLRQMLDENGE